MARGVLLLAYRCRSRRCYWRQAAMGSRAVCAGAARSRRRGRRGWAAGPRRCRSSTAGEGNGRRRKKMRPLARADAGGTPSSLPVRARCKAEVVGAWAGRDVAGATGVIAAMATGAPGWFFFLVRWGTEKKKSVSWAQRLGAGLGQLGGLRGVLGRVRGRAGRVALERVRAPSAGYRGPTACSG